MDLLCFVVEVEALKLGDLVLTRVKEYYELVVHLGEVVEERGDEEPIEVFFGGIVEEECLDRVLEREFIAHSPHYCTIILQHIKFVRQSVPGIHCELRIH